MLMLTQEQIDKIPGTEGVRHGRWEDRPGRHGVYGRRDGAARVDNGTHRHHWPEGALYSHLQAEIRDDHLTVPYANEQVKDAPSVDPDGGHLSPQRNSAYDHYCSSPRSTSRPLPSPPPPSRNTVPQEAG
jgi:hypothetical protein